MLATFGSAGGVEVWPLGVRARTSCSRPGSTGAGPVVRLTRICIRD
jgi:hypothetical protein